MFWQTEENYFSDSNWVGTSNCGFRKHFPFYETQFVKLYSEQSEFINKSRLRGKDK